ncbi:serine/threonine-protein kinase cot-1 [Dichotomopilus funicola]|uniref:non-specific serine/threonine protein kinase n=1 Tax=Dichotomopilus funicola TaxID=1934379 RepID=A0AAN6VB98_9PEZI|nr:serine/threonine-protein kinase cot-1 [Dichotomopilus funicola]
MALYFSPPPRRARRARSPNDELGVVEGRRLRFLRTAEKLSHYDILSPIGEGGHGKVSLVRTKHDKQLYALKQISKLKIGDELAGARAERDAHVECTSEWVVRLHAAFQDQESLYIVMEYCPGGDLLSLISKNGPFSDRCAAFYAAEIIMGVDALHQLGFMHRDLKPDNVLIASNGHLKLADFGTVKSSRAAHDYAYYEPLLHACGQKGSAQRPRLKHFHLKRGSAKRVGKCAAAPFTTYTAVSTYQYAAPETFTGEGYSFEADWWSLGVIIYLLLLGHLPFWSDTSDDDLIAMIVDWKTNLSLGNRVNDDGCALTDQAKNIILSLLCDCQDRLGRNGVAEIKAHPFFQGYNFDRLLAYTPPYKPSLALGLTMDDVVPPAVQTDPGPEMSQRMPSESELPFVGYEFKRLDKVTW